MMLTLYAICIALVSMLIIYKNNKPNRLGIINTILSIVFSPVIVAAFIAVGFGNFLYNVLDFLLE